MLNKRSITTALAKYVVNPATKLAAGYLPWWSLLETVGRKSGEPHRIPVGNGLDGDIFWIIAEHGHRADYVKNIKANASVRVRVAGRWRTGTAYVLSDDDARERQRSMRSLNAALVRFVGTDLLTVKVDLDP